MIKYVYEEVYAQVKVMDKSQGVFKLEKGIKQANGLSPLLFIIVMNMLIKNTRDQMRKYQWIQVLNSNKNQLYSTSTVCRLYHLNGRMEKQNA